MATWLGSIGSLNWANKKKLSLDINSVGTNLSLIKENMCFLASTISALESDWKELSERSNKQQLTANDILRLRPLLEESENYKLALSVCIAKLKSPNENEEENTLTHR